MLHGGACLLGAAASVLDNTRYVMPAFTRYQAIEAASGKRSPPALIRESGSTVNPKGREYFRGEASTLGAFDSHPFLSGLDNRLLMQLASGVKPFSAKAGEYLGREGKPATSFFLVQSGHVAIESPSPHGSPGVIQTIGPGEVIGWSWLLPPYQWQFDCRAVDTVQGLSLNAEWLRWQCEQNHELGYHLLKHLLAVVGGRLAATRRQLGGKGSH